MRVERDLGSDAEEAVSKAKTKAPEQTFEEVKYLRYLIDKAVPVRIRLSSAAPMTPRVASVSGTCTVRKSVSVNSVSKSTSSTPRRRSTRSCG